MKLLFITQDFPPGIGGIQTYSAEHASRLSGLCEDFLLLCPNAEGGLEHDSNYDFEVKRIESRNHMLFLSLFRKLPELLKNRTFDATFHSQWQTAWPALLAKKRGLIKQVFVAAHARELYFNPYRYIPLLGYFYQRKRKKIFEQVDHFYPVSDFTRRLLINQGVDSSKITVVENGTDPEKFRPMDVSSLKRRLGLEGHQVILSVTRLVKRKGLDSTLYALAELKNEFRGLRYLVLGSGPDKNRLKKLVSRLGLEEQVEFLGQVEHEKLPAYYNLADLFILSSKVDLPDVEGFGIVFLEANACKIPVIGTDSGGVSSAIEDRKTGLIISREKPEELAEAIRELLNSPGLARRMGEYGRKRIIQKLNWSRLSDTLFNDLKKRTEFDNNTDRAQGKRIVMVAPYFLPRRRVGSLRPFKFAIHLKDLGWEPHIITIKSEGEFTPLEKNLIRGIEIHEIDPLIDLTENKISDTSSDRDRSRSDSGGLGKKAASFIDRHFPLDTWLLLFRKEKRNILKLVSELKPDLIWSTGDPWSSHWLASKLSDAVNLPWIADFRDPWTLGGVELRSRSPFSRWVDRSYELKFLKRADFITFTAQSTEQVYLETYPAIEGKTRTITNSFDPMLAERSDRRCQIEFDDRYLNLLFFGKFRELSPAAPVAKILNEVSVIDPELLKWIRIYSFGDLEPEDRQEIERLGVENNFITNEPVPPEEGPQLMERADLLLISTDPRREHIIPAKLWEYLTVDRPILSITPNSEIKKILKETGRGIHFTPGDRHKIADFLIETVKAKKENKLLPVDVQRGDQKHIDRYKASSTTRQLVMIMEQLTGKRKR